MLRRLALVLTVLVAALLALPGLASADESIASYDVTIAVAANGSFHVREQLAYDFGSADRHGWRTYSGAANPGCTEKRRVA